MTRHLWAPRLIAAVMALALLASCGKRGAPSPPGPADEIIYPRTYPAR